MAVKTLPWEAIRSKSSSLKKSIKKEEAEMAEMGGVSLLVNTGNELPVMCKTLMTLTLEIHEK